MRATEQPHGARAGVVARIARNLAWVCGVLAVGALVWAPQRPQVALGVVGGGVLAGVALWALAGLAAGLGEGGGAGGTGRMRRAGALVKFFTRHAILAVAAYVMMVRWHLDPVAMLVGVTSVVAAVGLEAARPR